MNRNTMSRFNYAPMIRDIGRSKMDIPYSLLTSFNVGELVPLGRPILVNPGDTVKLKTSKVIRMPALLTPVMDNLFLDTYAFFVPERIIWSHFKNYMGENANGAWESETEYELPRVEAPENGWSKGSLADYFGIPTGIDGFSVNALPFRAYAMIVDQFFRSTAVDDPVNVPIDDTDITGNNGTNYITDLVKGGMPFKARKMADAFANALPSPQLGPDVLAFGGFAPTFDDVDVYTSDTLHTGTTRPIMGNLISNEFDRQGISGPYDFNGWQKVSATGGKTSVYVSSYNYSSNDLTNFGSKTDSSENLHVGPVGADYDTFLNGARSVANQNDSTYKGSNKLFGLDPMNLYAKTSDLSFTTDNTTVNQLRLAFQTQKLYEALARGGQRYREILRSCYFTISDDKTQQVPEYLGGKRCPISISASYSSVGDSELPQGNAAGYSQTVDANFDFEKSFSEHGYIILLAVARYHHTYQQGLDMIWQMDTRFSRFWPVFNNIGEQPIKNKTIYLQGEDAVNPETGDPYDDEVFGYQEAWWWYRSMQNMITGSMRSNYAQSLDIWHFGDDYDSLPHLSSSWLAEDKNNVDRALAVQNEDQLFGSFYFDFTITRNGMTMYSIPGLMDHH